jgi:hypothetical protein
MVGWENKDKDAPPASAAEKEILIFSKGLFMIWVIFCWLEVL